MGYTVYTTKRYPNTVLGQILKKVGFRERLRDLHQREIVLLSIKRKLQELIFPGQVITKKHIPQIKKFWREVREKNKIISSLEKEADIAIDTVIMTDEEACMLIY